MKKALFFCFVALFAFFDACYGQKQKQIDSLRRLVNISGSDTQKIRIYSRIAEIYRENESDSAIKYCKLAFELCDKADLPASKSQAFNTMAITYCMMGDYGTGREYFERYYQTALKSGDPYNIGNALGNIGIAYFYQGFCEKALENYLKAIPYMEKAKRTDGIANIYGNMGTVYLQLNKTKEAIEYFGRSIEGRRKMGDSSGLASNYSNLSEIYRRQRDFTTAIAYIEKALAINKFFEDYHTYAIALIDKSEIYYELKKFREQIAIVQESEQILLKAQDEPNLAQCYEMYGLGYIGLMDYDKAERYLLKGIQSAYKTGIRATQAACYEALTICYRKQGSYEKALQVQDSLIVLKDSLFNSRSSEQMAEMQTKYDTEKKESENKSLQEKNLASSKTIRQQQFIALAVGLICVLLIAFAFLVFRSNKQKQLANVELARKNHMIEKQKELVEEKQKEILDSIHYAQRIQRALLPSERYISRNLKK